MTKGKPERIRDLAKYDLCEEFACRYSIPVDYVWREFANPLYLEYEDVVEVLSKFGFPC